MKAVISGLGACVILLSLLACSRNQQAIIDLVPADSCAVMAFDWTTLRTDGDLKRLFKGDHFEAVFERLGVDSLTLKTLVVFSALNSRAKAGVLLQGSFDKQKQVTALKTRGWQDALVDGHKLYVNGSDYVAILRTNVMFAGTREAASSVFNTLNNPRESFTASAAYKKISAGMTARNEPVKAFLVIPQGTLAMADAALEATSFALSLLDLGGVGALLKQINIASGFSLILGHSANQQYPMEMCVLMRDEKTAVVISDSLNLLKGLSSVAIGNESERTGEVLRGMSISRKRDVLSIRLTVPQAVLIPSVNR